MGELTYLGLADDLARQMRRADPGTRVVSEHELAKARGVSRPTARAALQELERRYLVRRVRGAGTFVHRRIDYVIGPDTPPSWSATIRAAGSVPSSHVERTRTSVPAADVRRRLELGDGDRAVSLHRVTEVDGLPAGVATTHVPADLVPDVAELVSDRRRTSHVSLYEVLRDHGLDPVRTWTTASLEVPPPDIAARLGLVSPAPTWLVESVNRDRSTWRPVEAVRGWMRADVYRVVLELGDHRRTTVSGANGTRVDTDLLAAGGSAL